MIADAPTKPLTCEASFFCHRPAEWAYADPGHTDLPLCAEHKRTMETSGYWPGEFKRIGDGHA